MWFAGCHSGTFSFSPFDDTSLIWLCSVQILEGALVRTVFALFPYIINTDPPEVKSSITTSLARIPLRWMIRECFRMNSGILFLFDQLKAVNLNQNALHPEVKDRPEALPLTTLTPEERHIKPGPFAWFFGAPFIYPRSVDAGDADNHRKGPFVSEELADLKDSLAPISDQLKLNWFWWIPEILPFRQRYQEVDKKPQLCPVRKINLGFGRKIPKGHEGTRCTCIEV